MMFFDKIFKVKDDNYYGVSGLNSELSCVYVYNAFLSWNHGAILVTNSLIATEYININFSNVLLSFSMLSVPSKMLFICNKS